MSEGIAKPQPLEETDDSFVRLAEGNLEANPAPETPAAHIEAPAAENSENHEAAIAEVKERLAAKTEVPTTSGVEVAPPSLEGPDRSRFEKGARLLESLNTRRGNKEQLLKEGAFTKKDLERELYIERVENSERREKVFKAFSGGGTGLGTLMLLGLGTDAVTGGSFLGASGAGLAVDGILGCVGLAIAGISTGAVVSWGMKGYSTLKERAHRKQLQKIFG